MNKSLNSQLRKWKKQNGMNTEDPKPSKKKTKKQNEKLSEHDLEELMGVHKPTFRRHRGSWKSK